ncbi:hypothetical protein Tco_1424331 [Tanacetum coccineum]
MTKVTDVEANLEQFKIDQAAINSKTAEQLALLQETMEKNKVEVDRQFAELMNAIKTQQPSTTTPPVTLPPPTYPMPTLIYSNFSGFPLPMGSMGFGPFATGEQGSHYNRGSPMSKEGVFPSFGELSLSGGVSSGNTRMTPPPLVYGNERGWGPGTDYRLRKLKMPLC